MTLLLLLASVALAAFVYRSARHSPRLLGPLAGIAFFLVGWAVFIGPPPATPYNARSDISNTTRPIIATQIDPATLKPTRMERAASATGSAPLPSPQPRSDLSDKQRQIIWIEESKDGIRALLKDPDSAQFKGVFFSRFEGIPIACGQVNSKNGFGGYTGYQRFIASGNGVDILQDDMEPAEFAKSWNLMCRNNG